MRKLMIVDDNPWDLEGVRRALDWQSMGVQVVAVCDSGLKALHESVAHSPEIVLADIEMPNMTGLEMARRIRLARPDTKFIFFSCYDDFNYVHDTLLLEGEDYILKPIAKKSLEEAVLRTLRKIERDETAKADVAQMRRQIEQYLPAYQKQFLREVLEGRYKDPQVLLNSSSYLKIDLPDQYAINAACIEIMKSTASGEEQFYDLYAVKNAAESYNADGARLYAVQMAYNELVILFIEPINFPQRKIPFYDILIDLKDMAENKLNISIRMGISNPSENINDAPKLYKQAKTVLGALFYAGGNGFYLYSEIEELNDDLFDSQLDIGLLYRQVESAVISGSEGDLRLLLACYLPDDISLYSVSYVKNLVYTIINAVSSMLISSGQSFGAVFGSETVVWEKLAKFTDIADIKQWLYNIIISVHQYLFSDKKKYRKIVEQVFEIVSRRYNDHVTVKDIAKSVYMSTVQLNKIFTKATGKTVFEYLTNYRIDMSKRLLREPDSRINDIAANVGYSNVSHFCLLFKEMTGVTPLVYKNSL